MKMNKIKLQNNIWKIHLYEFLYSLMFFTPIIVLFYQDNWLSLTQIMTIQSIVSILWVLTEVPSWYFADRYGRKISLMLTGIFASLAMFFLGIWDNFYYFFVSAIFWVLAWVFISGADSALMYDTLKLLKREKEYNKIWWNTIFYYSIWTAFASIVWWFIWWLDLRYPFYVILPFYLFLIPLSLSLYEPKHKETTWNKNNIYKLLWDIKISVFKNKRLINLLLFFAIIASLSDVWYYLYQPYFKLTGLDIMYFWIIFAIFNLIQGISAKYSHLIEEKIWEKLSLIMIFLITSLWYILLWNIIFIFSFVFIFIFYFMFWFAWIVLSDYIHKETKSSIRATVLSLKGLITKIFYVILAPIIWYIADIYTLWQTFTIIWIITFVVWFVFLIPFLRKNK